MSNQSGQENRSRRLVAAVFRTLIVVFLAFNVGLIMNSISSGLERDTSHPAGLVRGMVQGAMMPMAMPNLLFGRDVVIYSANNTGRTYKLGYTLGTNVCGAIFFGLFFWRIRRLKLRRDKSEDRSPELGLTKSGG